MTNLLTSAKQNMNSIGKGIGVAVVIMWGFIIGTVYALIITGLCDHLHTTINDFGYRLADNGTHEIISWAIINNQTTICALGIIAIAASVTYVSVKLWNA